MGTRARLVLAVLAVLLVPAVAAAQQINLGHKLPGTLGLQAGVVPPAGLYVQGGFLAHLSDRIIDRNGQTVIRDLDLRVIADQVGVGVSFELKPIKALYGMAVGVPFARLRSHSVPPQLDVDRWGIGDIYLKPMQLGWRFARAELLASYAFYIPTGRFEPGPRGGVTSAQWTFEYSLGGTLYFDAEKKWRITALASYDNYGPKSGIDIIRGDSYFQSYICHIPRSTIELGCTGKLDLLDGMIFPSICDVIRNLGGMWQMLFPEKLSAYLDLPQNFDADRGGAPERCRGQPVGDDEHPPFTGTLPSRGHHVGRRHGERGARGLPRALRLRRGSTLSR
mgnify:CR=1 FL=1